MYWLTGNKMNNISNINLLVISSDFSSTFKCKKKVILILNAKGFTSWDIRYIEQFAYLHTKIHTQTCN